MNNEWRNVWTKRTASEEILRTGRWEEVFLELKRSNGYDVVGDGLAYDSYVKQYQDLQRTFAQGMPVGQKIKSLFEVGCGSGANLFLFERDGIVCGGIDYSEGLIKSAKKVLRTKDLSCMEASDLPVTPKYDAVISMGVFGYFSSEEYAAGVLEKMYQKANYLLAVIDIPDLEKEELYLANRRRTIPNYKERYRNLPRIIYKKEFFSTFAKEHNMKIKIMPMNLDGYWNGEFVYNCFLYK